MKNIALVLIIIGICSCVEINNVVTPGDKPVIEAYLAPGQIISMKVFTEIAYTEADTSFSEPINGLNIVITGSDGSKYALKKLENGIYESTEKLKTGSGTSYKMSFAYNGRNISAETIIPVKPKNFQSDKTVVLRSPRPQQGMGGGFPPLQLNQTSNIVLSWDNPDNVYHFVAAQLLDTNAELIDQPRPQENGNQGRPQRRFNNQPITTTSSSLPGQSFGYYGNYAVILYRLNPDYAALYQNSSTTSQNIATPISTISNGLGIFTGVHADTIKVVVKKP